MSKRTTTGSGTSAKGTFPATRWSLVQKIQNGSDEARFRALSELCEAYWFPLYAYVRRAGKNPEEAEDLTQGFFAQILERRTVENLDRVRGRLRSYFLAGIKNHIAKDWKRRHAQKRGGGAAHFSLDAGGAELRYLNEPGQADTPDRVFDRQWALTVMRRALSQLKAEYLASNKEKLFNGLQPYLDGKSKHIDAAEIGRTLEMSAGAVRVALHRMRHRLRQWIEFELQHTVGSEEEVAEELQHLYEAVG